MLGPFALAFAVATLPLAWQAHGPIPTNSLSPKIGFSLTTICVAFAARPRWNTRIPERGTLEDPVDDTARVVVGAAVCRRRQIGQRRLSYGYPQAGTGRHRWGQRESRHPVFSRTRHARDASPDRRLDQLLPEANPHGARRRRTVEDVRVTLGTRRSRPRKFALRRIATIRHVRATRNSPRRPTFSRCRTMCRARSLNCGANCPPRATPRGRNARSSLPNPCGLPGTVMRAGRQRVRRAVMLIRYATFADFFATSLDTPMTFRPARGSNSC